MRGYGLAALGGGMMQGMMLGREHRRQDEADQQRREETEANRAYRDEVLAMQRAQAGRQAEAHEFGLNAKRTAFERENAEHERGLGLRDGMREAYAAEDPREVTQRLRAVYGELAPEQMEEVMRGRDHLHREGLGQAIRLFQAGDLQGAIAEWNRHGSSRLNPEGARLDENGVLHVQSADGQPLALDMRRLMALAGMDAPERKTHSLGPGHGLYDDRGERIAYNPHYNAGAGGVGGAGDPAIVRTSQWLLREGIAQSPDEAWFLANAAKHDPNRFVLEYTKNYKEWMGTPGYPDLDDATIHRQAVEAYNAVQQQLREAVRGAGRQDGPGLQPQVPDALMRDPNHFTNQMLGADTNHGMMRADRTIKDPQTGAVRPYPEEQPIPANWTAPNGAAVTLQEIEATARNRGLTVQEVIDRLKLQPAGGVR